jgi:hypothetical protein
MVHTFRKVAFSAFAALGLLIGSASVAEAQEAVVRGLVNSDRGELVAVAAVQIPELNLQAFTGANGRFQITIPAARVLGQTVTIRVRAIGYKPTTGRGRA